jgi:hypothetical protein
MHVARSKEICKGINSPTPKKNQAICPFRRSIDEEEVNK